MQRFRNILVATDVRLDHHPIVDEAAEIAVGSGAALTIVDVVPPLPWLARLTMDDPQHVAELIADEKQAKLLELAMPIRDQGVSVATRVLHGKASEAITREVLQGDHDLLMRVAKAKTSRRKGFFGTTGIELLRKCPCAVWLVCTKPTGFQRVIACVDTSSDQAVDRELNDRVLEITHGICDKHDADLSILHAWSIHGEQFMQRRMASNRFDGVCHDRYRLARHRLREFLADHDIAVDDSRVQLIKGPSSQVIPKFAADSDADLVVIGTGARSGPAGWVLGNAAEEILDALACSVLAIKPAGFVSPIKLERASAAAR